LSFFLASKWLWDIQHSQKRPKNLTLRPLLCLIYVDILNFEQYFLLQKYLFSFYLNGLFRTAAERSKEFQNFLGAASRVFLQQLPIDLIFSNSLYFTISSSKIRCLRDMSKKHCQSDSWLFPTISISMCFLYLYSTIILSII